MFTPDGLLNLAAAHDAALMPQEPGTTNEYNYLTRLQRDTAFTVALYMERNGIKSAANIGPFESVMVAKGQKIRLRKGTIVHSTSKEVPSEGKAVGRTYEVTVFDVNKGYVDDVTHRENLRVINGSVTWVGRGGYWYWTDINNVEVV